MASVKIADNAYITTDSATSSYGRPVLRLTDPDGYYPAGTYGPSDVLRGPTTDPFGAMSEIASEYAARAWASRTMEGGKLSEDDVLCSLFCGEPVFEGLS